MSRRITAEFVLKFVCVALLALSAMTVSASANSKYAAMVIDGHSGKMLYGENVDSPRYPASITKVMTLYLVFEDLNAGKLKTSTKMKVSKYASRQQPSKLGLKPGATITVENAIRALVTKSANDVAVVIAEHIGGTEAKFAKRMTETARRLGMSKTTFRNPHGLPNSKQKTTARDLITLSRRIQSDFPKHYSYFSTKSFTYRGRTYRNHNKLLGRYKGTTGIKTGYIRASGYNLTASVDRGDKRIIAVVLGGRTGRSRDAHMKKIIDRALPKAVAYRGAPPVLDAPAPLRKPLARALARADIPGLTPQAASPVRAQPVAALAKLAASRRENRIGVVTLKLRRLAPRNRELPLAETISRPTAGSFALASARAVMLRPARTVRTVRSASQSAPPMAAAGYAPTTTGLAGIDALIRGTDRLAAAPAQQAEPVPARRPAKLILPPSSTLDRSRTAPRAVETASAVDSAIPAAPKPVPPVKRTQTAEIPSGYQIQVGAYAKKSQAEERIDDARKAATRHLAKAMGIAIEAENDKGRFYRARFAGMKRQNADKACKALKRQRIACIVVAQ